MNRFFLWLSASALLLGVLSGCGGTKAATSPSASGAANAAADTSEETAPTTESAKTAEPENTAETDTSPESGEPAEAAEPSESAQAEMPKINEPATSPSEPNDSESASPSVLSDKEFDRMIANPDDFKKQRVEFFSQVAYDPLEHDRGMFIQVYADPDNYGKHVLISMRTPMKEIKKGDFIRVKGIVKGSTEMVSTTGAPMVFPEIKTQSVEVVDYITGFSPSLRTVEVGETQDQHGLKVTLEKVEFAEKETRLYLSVENSTDREGLFYTHTAKIAQGSTQFEQATNFRADYPEPQNQLLPGIRSEGILAFGPIDPEDGDLRLIVGGSTNDYSLDFKPFDFKVSVQ
ncbi:hypothetical protein [Saccharibacillus sacchari]|uniref:hypothetical protein n=1 Tax=Saccharibacillus sacchari TaxID=456493 RepID=UPI0004B70C6E|nr:hypothetical protein [Saccharibacillus sacchari]